MSSTTYLTAEAVVAQRIETMPAEITVGKSFPSVKLAWINRHNGRFELVDTGTLFNGRKAVIITLPKAFTHVCSNVHLPSVVANAEEINKLGYEIFCLAHNAAEEMSTWGELVDPDCKVQMLPDWGADLILALGIGVDECDYRLGLVAKRGMIVVDDSTVTCIRMENDNGLCTVSSGDGIVDQLKEIASDK